MKIAVIHEWLVNYAGSGRVLEQIVVLYPEADLFCQVDFLTDKERGFILNKKTKTSLIRNLPFAKKKYRNYLPLMPFAVRRFDVSEVEFLGFQKDNVLKEYMQKARAFIFAAEEDFGIVPVEAQACGTPVIAFGKGGVTETFENTEHRQLCCAHRHIF